MIVALIVVSAVAFALFIALLFLSHAVTVERSSYSQSVHIRGHLLTEDAATEVVEILAGPWYVALTWGRWLQ